MRVPTKCWMQGIPGSNRKNPHLRQGKRRKHERHSRAGGETGPRYSHRFLFFNIPEKSDHILYHLLKVIQKTVIPATCRCLKMLIGPAVRNEKKTQSIIVLLI